MLITPMSINELRFKNVDNFVENMWKTFKNPQKKPMLKSY